MKSQRILIWTSFLLIAGTLSVLAEEKKENSKKTATETGEAQVIQPTEKTTLKNQTLCPVMGGVIDSAAFTDIQGQRVYHCCQMCSNKLTAKPDMYFKKAAEEGVLFENIQTNCPVSEMKLNDSVFTDYIGRRVYFGSQECRDTFLKEPAKYLSTLIEARKADAKPAGMPMKMKETTNGKDGQTHKHNQDS